MLAQYVIDTQDLLNDGEGQFFRTPTLHRYINKARRRIAAVSGCLRCVPPGVNVHPLKEVYHFTEWNALIQQEVRGAQSILACRSLSVAIGGRWGLNNQITGGGWKPMWRKIPWTDFQARFRIYNRTFLGTISEPGWFAQYGEGPDGKLYLAPIPSQQAPMEVDLTLIPAPLLSDNDPEPIPYPWTDAVSYWSATLCLLQQQRREDAQAMAQLFNADMPMAAAVVCPQMLQTPYGAVMRSA
jgi:hypothetical protein